MKTISIHLLTIILLFLISGNASCQEDQTVYLELDIYHYENSSQEQRLDSYLKDALIPALHTLGVDQVGAFKPRKGQPGADSTLYVLIPHESLSGMEDLKLALKNDKEFQTRAIPVLQAPHSDPAFDRKEVILMKAFAGFPEPGVPDISSDRTDRIYELRSYESATEFLYRRKVAMFNEGEADIFVRLGFQPVFFGDVISGSKIPRLIYLTTHANAEEQNQHWDAFRSDPQWEKMKNMERYANTVSHIDKYMLYPTEYSDF